MSSPKNGISWISTRGAHTLKLWSVDPGVVLDKIILDLGGLKPTHLGSPETWVVGSR